MEKKTKEGPKQAAKWILAAALILTVAWGLAVLLKPTPPAPLPEYGEGLPGIDVSSHQGSIDWDQVADHGVEFAMIRLGYRTYGPGTLHIDERAQENLDGAKAAGLKIGAYFFSQAVSETEAREEAALALEVLWDRTLDLPLVYDWEYVDGEARTASVTPRMLEKCIHAFCETVEDAGREPMIYFNKDLSQTRLDLDAMGEYPFWLALYQEELEFPHQVAMWQYTDEGTVPGIEANVDLNWYYPG